VLAAPALGKRILKFWFFLVFLIWRLSQKKKLIRASTMSTSVGAPQQFKQPSRKGKKAWRKNVDVTEVQEGLRQLKDAEIKGCVYTVHDLEFTTGLLLTFEQWSDLGEAIR
jgi:hypothetical protein